MVGGKCDDGGEGALEVPGCRAVVSERAHGRLKGPWSQIEGGLEFCVVRGGRLNRVPHTSGEQGRDAPLVPWGRQWPWSNEDPNPDGLLENIAADWADAVEGRHVTWAEVWASHSEVVSNASRLGANGDERQG